MLYLLISMALITVILHVGLHCYSTAYKTSAKHEACLQLAVALLYFGYDCKKASLKGWNAQKPLPNRCLLRVDKKDIGWFIKKNRLMRYVGHYNPFTKKWSHLSTSVVVHQIESADFKYTYNNNRCVGITCHLTKRVHDSHVSVHSFFAMRNL